MLGWWTDDLREVEFPLANFAMVTNETSEVWEKSAYILFGCKSHMLLRGGSINKKSI